LGFVTTLDEIETCARQLALRIHGDAIIWMCYPKKSSKAYTCNFNRDTGWAPLGKLGLEPVRQVAIDQDWSALRFRKIEFIPCMTRAKEMRISSQH
jgi:hypothetical protein